MRIIHQYYVHHYNEVLKLRRYEEEKAPCVDQIDVAYEQISRSKSALIDIAPAFAKFTQNYDITELNMTKDVCDYEASFLNHLRVSIE